MKSGRTLRYVLYTALGVLFLLHQDVWFWNDPRRVLGLPVGLVWHAGLCLGASLLFALLVRWAWPAELE